MDISFDKEPNAEALQILGDKATVSRQVFDGMLPELRARAFLITGIEAANVLQAAREQIAGLARDRTWTQAKEGLVETLSPYLGDGAEQRATLLLRTHCFQAFQSAQYRAIQQDDGSEYMQYLATEDDRVRATHLALNGIVLPKKDKFWDRHYPPWEWNCRCRVRAINQDMLDDIAHEDLKRNPEDKLVLTGAVKRRLEDQNKLVRGTRDFNFAPKEGENAYTFHPENLTIPLEELKARYDPEVWNVFRQNAQKQVLTEDQNGYKGTVWDWLMGRPQAGTAGHPAQMEAHLAGEDRTVATAYDARGKLLGEDVGHGPSLQLPKDMLEGVEGGTVVVNHQSGLPPTASNYQFTAQHKLFEMRVVVPHGTWVIRQPAGGWTEHAAATVDALAKRGLDPDQLVLQMRDIGLRVALADHGAALEAGPVGETGNVRQLGVPDFSARAHGGAASGRVAPAGAAARLAAGERVQSEVGSTVTFGRILSGHYAGRPADQRLVFLPAAIETVKHPIEVWERDNRRYYLGKFKAASGKMLSFVVVTARTGEHAEEAITIIPKREEEMEGFRGGKLLSAR